MKASNKILVSVLLFAVFSAIIGCGSKKNGGVVETASREIPQGPVSASSKPIAFCSTGAGAEISAKLKAYSDGNTYSMNYVLVKLSSLPANFSSNVSYLTMWKWLANSSGTAHLDGTALNFILVDDTDGKTLTTWKKSLMWQDVSAIAESKNISDPKAFFEKVTILVDLRDVAGEYDALNISNYELGSDKTLSQMNALLPFFHANPADYAIEKDGSTRATALQNLHPFKAYLGQGFSASQFQTMADDLCY